jgi:hypothetical protein
MFELSASATPTRSPLGWFAFTLFAAGAGLIFVEYRHAGYLLMGAGGTLDLLGKSLARKNFNRPAL